MIQITMNSRKNGKMGTDLLYSTIPVDTTPVIFGVSVKIQSIFTLTPNILPLFLQDAGPFSSIIPWLRHVTFYWLRR